MSNTITIQLNPRLVMTIRTPVQTYCICYRYTLCLQSLFFSFMQNLEVYELLKMASHCSFNLQHITAQTFTIFF